jgi:hypothetical protein
MATVTTAGRLLNRLQAKSPELLDAVLQAAGLQLEDKEQLIGTRLEVADQLRLAAAVIELAPDLSREAHRLHGQATAASEYSQGITGRSSSAPLGSAHGRSAPSA